MDKGEFLDVVKMLDNATLRADFSVSPARFYISYKVEIEIEAEDAVAYLLKDEVVKLLDEE